jgi:hypothetical protein
MTVTQLKYEGIFLMHCVLAFGAFFVPILISWQVIVPILLLTVLQHAVYGRCLLMSKHGADESDGSTFYSIFLERIGFNPPKRAIRFFVRKILYTLLALITLWWQVYLRNDPLWF